MLDAGINFIDTADGYAPLSQKVGKALAGGRRANAVHAVKLDPPFDKKLNHSGASQRWGTEGVEGSLGWLQIDWIDRISYAIT